MNINFEKNSKIIWAAKKADKFTNKIFLLLLKILIFLGATAAIFLFFNFLGLFSLFLSQFSFIFNILVFIGLLAFLIWIFSVSYFREIENKNRINTEKENQSIFEFADFETVKILDKITRKKEYDLIEFLNNLSSTDIVRFIISKINPQQDFWQQILSGFPSSTLSEHLEKIIKESINFLVKEGYRQLTTADILYGVLKTSENFSSILLSSQIDEDDLKNIIFWEKNLFEKIKFPKTFTEKLKSFNLRFAEDWISGYTNTLNRFSIDLTNPKFFNTFSIQGRENILNLIENTLLKEVQNNCLLVGKNGVGKTTIVYGFAENVYWGKTDPKLAYKRVVALDTRFLLSSLKDPKEAEFYLVKILDEALSAGNVILFIDEIQNLTLKGVPGALDATEILLRYLENPNLKIIATANEDDFYTYIQPKGMLVSNFEMISVPELDKNGTIKILEDVSLYYSLKNKIQITYNALKEIYKLADRLIVQKGFPAKAVDLLESITSQARVLGKTILDKQATLEVAEKIFNVPLLQAEGEEKSKLLNLEQAIHQRVINQQEAVVAICDALRRARVTRKDNKKPIGSFLFLGPTGVGKTELSKTLAYVWFNSDNQMIRMDMSEYQDKEAVLRFIGKKIPGQKELEGGDFIKQVRVKPYSVILLDEIEKASADILNIFLQVLDEGHLTDGMGKKVYFSDSIIIATSNAGANLIREGVKKGVDSSQLKESLLNYLQESNIFTPEFLNRFDGVILFKPLKMEELLKIAKLMFLKIQEKFKNEGYIIEAEEEVFKKIVNLSYKPEYGAREMHRVFQDKIETFLAKKILEEKIKKGERFLIKEEDVV